MLIRILFLLAMHVTTPAYDLRGAPTLTAAEVDAVLAERNPELVGLGSTIYKLSIKYGIDDIYLMSFWGKENQFGSDGSVPARLHNPGNLTYTKGCKQTHCWQSFPTWKAGIEAWYELVSGPLYIKAGLTTVDEVADRYAPPYENRGYAEDIKRIVRYLKGRNGYE